MASGICSPGPGARWYQSRLEMVRDYQGAYRRYCWPVESIADFKLASFHVLTTEKRVHVDKDHEWHMATIHDVCGNDSGILLKTPYKIVDLNDSQSQKEAAEWWEELTGNGGEGIVVKPYLYAMSCRVGVKW